MAERTRPGVARKYFYDNLYTDTDDCKLWPFSTTNYGYGVLVIQQQRFGTHVLACQAFNGPKPSADAEALHGECNRPACFNGRHLHWGTHLENMQDQWRDGTRSRGASRKSAKLTEVTVREIRARWATGEPLAQIAADYGITKSTVSNIGLRQRWQWLS